MKLGLIGYPLGHSWSPILHRYFINESYDLYEFKEDEVVDFLKKKDFDGLNVTIPYKQFVMDYLDEIDTHAKEIGAVNTIVNRDGKLIGYNTDYDGLRMIFERHHLEVSQKKVAILGTGGASKAVKKVVEDLEGIPILVSRKEKDGCITYENLYQKADEIDVIINTTPVGMFPREEEMPIQLDMFKSLQYVIDIIANPLRTKLQFEAKCLGIPYYGGFEMLVGQAWKADEYFTGQGLEKELIDACMKDIINDRRNIVLIGMPTSGKTTISKELSKQLNMEVIEMDEVIAERLGMSIRECFQTKGEKYFRDMETTIAKEVGQRENCIISCGGGIIKRKENMEALSRRGTVIWIKRSLKNLYPSDDRPLSASKEAIDQLYEERKEYYQLYADIEIENDGDIQSTIDTMIKEVKERGTL